MPQKKIVSIKVLYSDGQIEEFPQELLKQVNLLNPYRLLSEYFTEQYYLWDKDIALFNQTKEHNEEISLIMEEHDQEIVDMKDKYQHGLVSQKGSLSGEVFEKYCPLAPEYSSEYDLRDIIHVNNVFDYLALMGKNQGWIHDIELQEMKTGGGSLSDLQRSLRDTIRKGNVKFSQWRMNKDTGKWHKVKEIKKGS